MNLNDHLLPSFTKLPLAKEGEHQHFLIYSLPLDQLNLPHNTLRILLHHHTPNLAALQASNYSNYLFDSRVLSVLF